MNGIPAIIWIYWQQGWDQAPEVCKQCLHSWKTKNPGWTINILHKNNLQDFIEPEKMIPGLTEKNIPYEAYSDIVRILLLERYGGVWVDSTVFCLEALNNWLLPQLNNSFFAFANPAPGRMIGSWFLVSAPENYIVSKWREKTIQYWNQYSERHNYFWFHQLFGELYKEDSLFKKEWDQCYTIPADIPHYFVPYEESFNRSMSEYDKRFIDIKAAPVLKLTHKYEQRLVPADSVLNYLLYGADFYQEEKISEKIHRELYAFQRKMRMKLKVRTRLKALLTKCYL